MPTITEVNVPSKARLGETVICSFVATNDTDAGATALAYAYLQHMTAGYQEELKSIQTSVPARPPADLPADVLWQIPKNFKKITFTFDVPATLPVATPGYEKGFFVGIGFQVIPFYGYGATVAVNYSIHIEDQDVPSGIAPPAPPLPPPPEVIPPPAYQPPTERPPVIVPPTYQPPQIPTPYRYTKIHGILFRNHLGLADIGFKVRNRLFSPRVHDALHPLI